MNNIAIVLSSPPKSEDHQKALSEEGRRVLRLLDKNYFPEMYQTDKIPEIDVAKGGRPFFIDFHADFNISHSKNVVAVAYAKGACRVGCDIQYMDKRKNLGGIAKRAFLPEECVYAENSMERFYQLWTLKESYIKLYGLSVFSIRGLPSFAGKNGLTGYFFSKKNFFDIYTLSDAFGDTYTLTLSQETDSVYDSPCFIRFSEKPMFHVKHFWRSTNSKEQGEWVTGNPH